MTERKGSGRTTLVSFWMPRTLLKEIDKLVEAGYFNNRSEAIRVAVYYMIRDINRGGFKAKMLPEAEVGYR